MGSKGNRLILVQEYWGLVDHIKDLAERFGKAGRRAVAEHPELIATVVDVYGIHPAVKIDAL